MKVLLRLLLCCASLCLPHLSFGWNGEGHMVVAQIAYNHLTPEVKARCDSLIAVPLTYSSTGTSNFVTAACWADDYKSQLGNGIQHYIDLPVSLDGTTTNGVATAASNVVQALNLCIATLQNSAAAATNQAASLRFLIHFVGDIQQPLHCSTGVSASRKSGDGGGNTFYLSTPWSNLHSLWDQGGGYLTNSINRPLDAASQDVLNAKVADVEAQYPYSPNPGTLPDPMTWAQEGQALALSVAYAGVSPNTNPASAYLTKAQLQTAQRMAAGGHRLADLLNTLFTTNAVTLRCNPVAGGQVSFSWSAISNRTYTVQYKPQLSDPTWTPLATITASSNSASFSEPAAQTQRYYRVAQ